MNQSSSFIQQYRLLLWKNLILKVRRPIATFIEILIPIGVIILLMVVRNGSLKNNMDRCYLREKNMDSLGPIPFIRDFICTFNSTCYINSSINWNNSNLENDYLTLINNISKLYATYPMGNISVPSFIQWISTNNSMLQYILGFVTNLLSPLMSAYNLTSNNASDTSFIKGFSSLFCGSSDNDMTIFLQNFVNVNPRSKRDIASCQRQLIDAIGTDTFGTQIYMAIAPILFGKIYYTPNSAFTLELVRRSNLSFVILDNLRLAAIEWRLNFKDWIIGQVSNNSQIRQLRNLVQECAQSNTPQLVSRCAPINAILNPVAIKSFLDTLSTVFRFIEDALNCVELNKFVPVDSPAVIDNFTPDFLINTFAGLVFDPTLQYLTIHNATFLNYTIRMPTNRIDTTTNYKVLDRYWTPAPRRNMFSDMKYYTSGFLMLQEAVDRAFIAMVTNNQTVNIGSSMQIMPSPCYTNDKFIRFASNLMPFILVIAWSPTFSILVKSIVNEKEKRLKEFMLIMGLSHFVHWLAWFTITFLITIIPNVCGALILTYVNVLPFSSAGVLLLLFVSYSVAFISQGFMLSVCFNKANIAAVASGLLYFVFYVPFLILINVQDDVTYSIYFASGLFAQVSFCNAWYFIAYWEQSMVGAQFSNLYQSTVLNLNFGVGHCIAMLWIDTAIYLFITWYVEAVFPGQYGIPKPWLFFVTKQYWFPNRKSRPEDITLSEVNSKVCGDSSSSLNLEAVSDNLSVGISIQNLTKIFPKMSVPSVDNLNLNFYKSQITAFLGHNGAGKTTTISMLTGIFPPTSGTAFIANQDLRHDIDSIRKILGLCPQHNILFDNLTVEDHIYFYGLLKGMSLDEIKTTLPGIVDDVGLTKKIKTQSKQLSGGMKRKLSVAMAFIGGSQAIFLDEPTAGVDPFARRGIWDMLIKYRGPEKTIVLTTHHMDEADFLSDRIAIISQGKLKCCGSSVFLKRQFGDGYSLILVKTASAQEEEFTENKRSDSGENVLQFVKKQINNTKFVDETRTQWNIILPLDGLNNNGFVNLFRSLDDSLDVLNIASYGLSDTSLEDVFLNVTDDPSKSDRTEICDDLADEGIIPRPVSRSSFRDRSLTLQNQLQENNHVKFDIDCTLLSGFALLRQQILGLHIKRFHYTKRNIKGLFAELILPILMIVVIVGVLTLINPLSNQPPMIIHPWLMIPKARGWNLNTFYRKENLSNREIDTITNLYRTDRGESGVRCMNRLANLQCSPIVDRTWSPGPLGIIPLDSPSCDCNKTGYQQCSNPLSGGPPNSYSNMASSDVLNDLSGYNISDHLMKKFDFYAKKQYGGYQFLLPSYFGLVCKGFGNLSLWNQIRGIENGSNTNFVNYFQQFLELSGVKTNFSRIWVDNKGYVSWPAYANIFGNLLLRARLNSSVNSENYGISVSTYPFKNSRADLISLIYSQMFLAVSLADFIILALALIPASFVLFLIEERDKGSKRQQFVSGVNPYVYWVSNFCWDIVKYLISALLIVLVFVAFNYQMFIGAKNVYAFIAILCLYGFAVIPHMYPFSFVISTPSTAFVVLSAYNMFIGCLTTVTTFFLDQQQIDQPNLGPINDVLKRLFLIFPQYGLGRGLMDISSKYLQYNISNGAIDYNPFHWDIVGKNLASFGILFVFWSAFILIIESGIIHRTVCKMVKHHDLHSTEMYLDTDFNVALERERVKMSESGSDVLSVFDLTKMYNQPVICDNKCCRKSRTKTDEQEKHRLAVNHISFGVKAGECFGLLGVNGAGKTTTFKMLTGEVTVTNGEATINGKSIINNMVEAHRNMGFCPQFDALHPILTCEEELYFYCRIRGIESALIKSTVESSFLNLSLTPHATKKTENLSGGNKRKLSTAISLIGSPKVIFMDEPTSGMDSGARRFLWTAIKRLTNQQRAVILTSHNMEECEVLCHRLAIMVNGKFQCLGSVQQLKSEFGDDYYVTLRMNPNCDETGDRDKIKAIMTKEFESNVFLKDENFISLKYRMDPGSYKLHMIFDFFENLKSTGLIVDYSVSQTTLDEIFINFAKKEDISLIRSAGSIRRSSQDNRLAFINPTYHDIES